MCGRYASSRDPAKLAAEFDAADATGQEAPSADYNVAPTKRVLSVVERPARDAEDDEDRQRSQRSIRVMRWGLVPKWAKDPSIGNRMINAKAETVTGKPAFRSAIRYHRCLLPADGWFEWKRDGRHKQPYFMTPGDGGGLAFAGIWASWRDPQAADDAPPLVTCSVLTTAALGALAEVHERMPLVLPRTAWSRWLAPDVDDVDELLASPDHDLIAQLEIRPISSAVNNVRNNGPELLKPVPDGRLAAAPGRVALDGEHTAPTPTERTDRGRAGHQAALFDS